MLLDNATIW